MAQLGRWMLIVAGVLAFVGVLLLIGDRFGLGRLPGDIIVRRKSFTFYFPLATSIVVSIVLTILLSILGRRH